MDWRPIGNKPLFQPMVTKSTDGYMRHSTSNIPGQWMMYHITDVLISWDNQLREISPRLATYNSSRPSDAYTRQ